MLKRKIAVAVISIVTITTLLFAGCSNTAKYTRKINGGNSNIAVDKDATSITDSDLMNLDKQDTSTQLDSIDISDLED